MAEGNSDTVLYCSLFAASKYVQALSPDRLANTKHINMSFRSVPLTLHSLHIASEGGGKRAIPTTASGVCAISTVLRSSRHESRGLGFTFRTFTSLLIQI